MTNNAKLWCELNFNKMNKSFKIALANLIDETDTFTRSEWSKYLLVSEAAISQWVKGKTMPKAEYLSSVLLYLENFEKKHIQEYLLEFHRIADLPIEETLDEELQERYKKYKTITEYITTSYMYGFEVELSELDGIFRKHVLYACSNLVRSVKEVANDCSEPENVRILNKALIAFTEGEIEKSILESMMKLAESHSDNVSSSQQNKTNTNRNFLSNRLIYLEPDFDTENSVSSDSILESKENIKSKSERHEESSTKTNYFCSECKMYRSDILHLEIKGESFEKISEKEHLINLLYLGDRSAFKSIFEQYYNLVCKYISDLYVDRKYLDDYIKEVFLLIWMRKNRLRNADNFETYVAQLIEEVYFIHLKTGRPPGKIGNSPSHIIYEQFQEACDVLNEIKFY
jgi:hypothetical protein